MPPASDGHTRRWIPPALLAAWTLVLCLVPDPRPLGAPAWAVAAIRAVTGIDEPAGRMIATLALRTVGLALLGALVALTVRAKRSGARSVATLLLAPLLANATLWVNLGSCPIPLQIGIASVSAGAGALAALALQGSRVAVAILPVGLAGLFAWGTANGISDELDHRTREVGGQLLSRADDVPDGDAGFARLMELAFDFSATSTHDADPVLANRAAILALAVILGEEKIAMVADREFDPSRLPAAHALRQRIAVHGRKDWVQHFWSSAGLSVLADGDRSIAVGLAKELMDSTHGGSGFSFADLAADEAGNRFTRAATHEATAARELRSRIHAGVRIGDFVPDLSDLPEGLTREQLHDRFGGLGGAKTQQVVEEIRRRLDGCAGLRP